LGEDPLDKSPAGGGHVKKLLLIAPSQRTGTRALFPPLSLGVVAALTPENWAVEIVDEAVEPVDFERRADLVGMTVMTPLAPRAYEIAARFREKGIPVVLGGIHPTVLPTEAARHADAVVVGEAEGVWPRLLKDAEKRRLHGLYRSRTRPELSGLPAPRRDLYKPGAYVTTGTVQTSRGCPFSCDFCAVTRFYGRTYRWRPVADIVSEVATLGQKIVFFVDDNIFGAPARARQLFQALIPLGITWVGQSSINIARNTELLRLAARSGCRGLFVGLESLVPDNLRQVGKNLLNRVEDYRESVSRLQDHGIGVEGAFIFGLDGDDPGVFARTVDFARRIRLAAAQFGILTPFPGTPLRKRLEKEKRILSSHWNHYTISKVVFRPAKMSAEALQTGFDWAYRSFYSYPSILARLLPQAHRFRGTLPFFLKLNLYFREIAVAGRRGTGLRVSGSDGLGLNPTT
jgi:radical SAM superfamily enzyme YgiQ (UPF0313 family)